MKHWSWIVPLIASVALAIGWLSPLGWWTAVVCAPALIGAVLAAVHHAEVIAHRVGEPFGTLVLALAVTMIEVSLMVALMLGGGPDAASLPRDTLFATIMIIVNGVIGICLLMGGIRHREQAFRIEGTGAAFAALITLSILVLVLPAFTTTTPGPTYSPAQLAFAAIASLVMWSVFVFGQTVRHREYFLAVKVDPSASSDDEIAHVHRPSVSATWASVGWLLLGLIAVVGLAKTLSPLIEHGLAAAGAPKATIGIAIALLVLLPETWAAIRAARANHLQTSLNLALGSALATIGLTVPAVVVVATILGMPLTLGLNQKDMILLFTSFLVGAVTLNNGRTNVMLGAIHLVLFAAFLFLALVP